MVKIIKNEFRRTLTPKIVLVCILVAAWLITIIGMTGLFNAGTGFSLFSTMANFGGFFLALGLIGMFIYLMIESILLLSRDLSSKEGYMLFMTPNSNAKILGAKMIMMLISLVIATILTIILIASLFAVIKHNAGTDFELIWNDPIFLPVKILIDGLATPGNIIVTIISNLVSWCYVVSLGFVVVILTSFIKIKNQIAKSFLAVIIFITVNQIISIVFTAIPRIFATDIFGMYNWVGVQNTEIDNEIDAMRAIVDGYAPFVSILTVIYGILAVAAFIISVKMLDKKVDI